MNPVHPTACHAVTGLVLAAGLAGCVTAGSVRGRLETQTQQNRALLRIEQQRSRELMTSRASLQQALDEKIRERDRLENQISVQPVSQQSGDRAEIDKINSEINKLKKAILDSSD